jgi:hypothetical protein
VTLAPGGAILAAALTTPLSLVRKSPAAAPEVIGFGDPRRAAVSGAIVAVALTLQLPVAFVMEATAAATLTAAERCRRSKHLALRLMHLSEQCVGLARRMLPST